MLFLDGGIFANPLFYIVGATNNSKLLEEVYKTYSSFIESVKMYKVLVAGIVKDSRKNTFINWLLTALPILIKLTPRLRTLLQFDYRGIFRKSNDITFINYLLNEMERTMAMNLDTLSLYVKISSVFENKIKLNKHDFCSFYIKTAPYDVPLRVELFSPIESIENAVEKISSVIASLASYSRTFSLPSILVEADNRAKILQRDAELIFKRLVSRAQFIPYIQKKRRNRMTSQGREEKI